MTEKPKALEKIVSAEEISKEFKEHSVAEFFKKNMQMLGLTGKIKTLTTVVHEYTTNSVTWNTPTVIRVDGETRIGNIGKIVDESMEKNGFEYSGAQKVESLRDFKKFEVLCFDKETNQLKFKEVKSLHRHKMAFDERIFEITTVGGRKVETTRHHGLFTLREGKMVEVKAIDLNIGDYVVVPRKSWVKQTRKEINLLEEALKLSDQELGEFSVFGVKKLLYKNESLKNKIKSQLSPTQRNLDFYRNYMKCDRLPVKLLKILSNEERQFFYGCKIGTRHCKYKLATITSVTKELMQFLGLYIAEGSTRKTLQCSYLSFGSHEKELIDYTKKLVETLFGFKAFTRKAHKTAVNIVLPSTISFILTKIFKTGIGAKHKKIPSIVFNSDSELSRHFLIAYLAGDGYPSGKIFQQMLENRFDLKEKITLATASNELSLGLQYLLSALGYSYSFQKIKGQKRTINNITANFGENFRIEFYTSQKNSPLNFFPLEIGGIEAVIEPKLKWAINKRGQQIVSFEKVSSLKIKEAKISEHSAKFIAGDLGVLQVTAIKERLPEENEFVYDYSVENDENFVGGFGAICLHNSLDACEEARILPDIEIQLAEIAEEYIEVTAKDNGPGLTESVIGKALGQLLAGTKFHRMVQMRGQQGIGAAGCTMLSQITTGKSVKVITGTGNSKPVSLEINIDAKKNQPKISNVEELKRDFQGLIVKAKFKGVKFVNSEQGPLEYLRRTAVANPHAKIKFIGPDKTSITFNRSAKEIPKKPLEMKPHPKGATVDEVATLAKYTEAKKVSSFLKTEFDRIGEKAITEIAKGVSFDLNKDPHQLEWEEAEEIYKMFKKISFIAPKTDGLIPIGEERVKKSLQTIVEPEYLNVVTRKPQVYKGGFPFQVEVAIAYGGKAGRETSDSSSKNQGFEGPQRKIEIMRFANRAPLLFDSGGCAITKAVQSIDWKRYGIKDFENAPMTVFVNLISVHIPYTSAGKQAISDEEEVMEELRLALMDAGRKTGLFISSKLREQEKQNKRKIFMKYAKEVAIGLHELTKKPVTELEKKLLDIVMHKLKIEEAQEAKQIESGEIPVPTIENQQKQKKQKKGKPIEEGDE